MSPADTTEHLDKLLAGFCFKSDVDRANYLSLMITAVLVTKFGAHKPASWKIAIQRLTRFEA